MTVYVLSASVPISLAIALTLIILDNNIDEYGNPVFYTYSSVYTIGVVSYSLIMVVLIKKLNLLDKDGAMDEQKRSVNFQFIVFLQAMIVKLVYYLVAT